MLKYKTITTNGLTIHIIEAKKDLSEKFQISVIGDKYNTPTAKQYCGNFHDLELESQGWELVGLVNGGLFFTESEQTYSVGIEKCSGIVNENDDASKDNVITLYHDLEMLYVNTQGYVKENLDKYRGAVTGAFGLVNNGLIDTRGRVENSSQYKYKSGRTIVGKKSDGTLVLASFKGTTGVSGLTGYQTALLAKNTLGLRNAVCMDGGGSVFFKYLASIKINTTRAVKNGIALYRKK